MTKDEKKKLAEASIPLVVICGQIKFKPYKELSLDFQQELLNSLDIIQKLLFDEKDS